MKAIPTVMNITEVVMKIWPVKFQVCVGFEPMTATTPEVMGSNPVPA